LLDAWQGRADSETDPVTAPVAPNLADVAGFAGFFEFAERWS
jgi:hypothetical protein